jgi:hypothetical protein
MNRIMADVEEITGGRSFQSFKYSFDSIRTPRPDYDSRAVFIFMTLRTSQLCAYLKSFPIVDNFKNEKETVAPCIAVFRSRTCARFAQATIKARKKTKGQQR